MAATLSEEVLAIMEEDEVISSLGTPTYKFVPGGVQFRIPDVATMRRIKDDLYYMVSATVKAVSPDPGDDPFSNYKYGLDVMWDEPDGFTPNTIERNIRALIVKYRMREAKN